MSCLRMLHLNRLLACALPFLVWFAARDDALLEQFCLLFVGTLISLPPKDLFERCAQIPIDEVAWRMFFKRYNADVEGAIRRIIRYPPHGRYCSLFDDIMQRFYERLLENDRRALHALRGKEEAQACAYLRTIAAGVAYKVIAREQRQGVSVDGSANEGDDNLRTSRFVIRDTQNPSEDAMLLWETIETGLEVVLRGRNKQRNKLIFKLAVWEGFTSKEIFWVSGLRMKSSHAIEQLVSRIRRKLQTYLQKQ